MAHQPYNPSYRGPIYLQCNYICNLSLCVSTTEFNVEVDQILLPPYEKNKNNYVALSDPYPDKLF